MKTITKKAIDVLLELSEQDDYNLDDCAEIERLLIDMRDNIQFTYTCLEAMGNYWVQVEYYSYRLGKSIVWDCDAQDRFDDIEELAQWIDETNKEIVEFEELLPNLSACAYIE